MNVQIVLFLIFFSQTCWAQFSCQKIKNTGQAVAAINNNAVSDSIDILEYNLSIDATQIEQKKIEGIAIITFKTKIESTQKLYLDLDHLPVDSVFWITSTSNEKLKTSFGYNQEKINLNLPKDHFNRPNLMVKIYYHGSPKTDPSNWGGMHYNPPYYYNLGVGFGVNPHTYGRAWFPCFDNFVEKAVFTFNILTKKKHVALCNGIQTSSTPTFNQNKMQQWVLTNPIPTYLASLAIAEYETVFSQADGIPIEISALEKDTAKAKISFQNLGSILEAYNQSFGRYAWQKVGYVLTPIGAMEHATSIHLPVHLANGSLDGEDIIAHELAHHWWGNLVTCETAEDMWINEGMAEWSSHFYEEYVYSKEKYLNTVAQNAHWVIKNAASRDGAHLPIYGMPNSLTYGAHTYQKGAMVAHNLRGYLGDSLFFYGLETLLENHKFATLNSVEFNTQLSKITQVDLSHFFNDWIFNAGYPVIAAQITSVNKIDHNFEVKIAIHPGVFEANKNFKNLPFFLNLTDFNGQNLNIKTTVNNDTLLVINSGFKPLGIELYPNQEILTATFQEIIKLDKPKIELVKTNLIVTAKTLQPERTLLARYHYTGPSKAFKKGYEINTDHFWHIEGNYQNYKSITATFYANILDHEFRKTPFLVNQDRVVMLHRKSEKETWKEISKDEGFINLTIDKNGQLSLTLTGLNTGDYVLANKK